MSTVNLSLCPTKHTKDANKKIKSNFISVSFAALYKLQNYFLLKGEKFISLGGPHAGTASVSFMWHAIPII